MKTITDLKPGDIFYGVYFDKITRYEYLCPMPRENKNLIPDGKYHILINRTTQEPVRIYYTTLTNILDEGLSTYEEAQDRVIENLKNRIESINERKNK